jgi:hypothetical protein
MWSSPARHPPDFSLATAHTGGPILAAIHGAKGVRRPLPHARPGVSTCYKAAIADAIQGRGRLAHGISAEASGSSAPRGRRACRQFITVAVSGDIGAETRAQD